MKTRLVLAAVGVLAGLSSPAMAQFRLHSDYGGYTSRMGGMTYAYRYDSGATYLRTGNFATYSANNGTTGYSYYTPTYRYDSFRNSSQGWSGSGITFYRPAYTTYSRTYAPSWSGCGRSYRTWGYAGASRWR